MLIRFLAVLLISICVLNATSVSGFSSLLEKDEIQNASVLTQSDLQQDDDSVSLVSASHSQDDHKSCGEQHSSCHQCHLGHCNFTIADTAVKLPDLMSSRHRSTTASYTSIDLSTLQRPPLA